MNILNCPFCGGNATTPEKESESGRPIWVIRCEQFCVSMRRGSKKEVMEDWNTRTQPTNQQEQVRPLLDLTCPTCGRSIDKDMQDKCF